MRTDKDLRIARAGQLAVEHPAWGRNKINEALRAEFGSGLRNAELNKLQKEIGTSHPKVSAQVKEIRAAQIFTTMPNTSIRKANQIIKEEYGQGISGEYLSRTKSASQMTATELERIISLKHDAYIEPVKQVRRIKPVVEGQRLPEVSRNDYMKRADFLAKAGFYNYEWMWLAYHDLDSKAMRRMISDRVTTIKEFKAKGFTYDYIQFRFFEAYKRYKWFFKDGRFNPFKMLESYYRKDRQGMPTDKTPTTKRAVIGNRDFNEGLKRTRIRKHENYK